jgi:hypothetical protein
MAHRQYVRSNGQCQSLDRKLQAGKDSHAHASVGIEEGQGVKLQAKPSSHIETLQQCDKYQYPVECDTILVPLRARAECDVLVAAIEDSKVFVPVCSRQPVSRWTRWTIV